MLTAKLSSSCVLVSYVLFLFSCEVKTHETFLQSLQSITNSSSLEYPSSFAQNELFLRAGRALFDVIPPDSFEKVKNALSDFVPKAKDLLATLKNAVRVASNMKWVPPHVLSVDLPDSLALVDFSYLASPDPQGTSCYKVT